MKRWAAFLLAAMLLLSGCGAEKTAFEASSSAPSGPAGRYVEAEITPPAAAKAQSVWSAALRPRSDGTLEYLVSQEEAPGESAIRHYRSFDGGTTWETVETDWLREMVAQCGYPEQDLGSFFPAMEIDGEGNIYCALWDTENNMRFFRKPPQGRVAEYPMKLEQESRIIRVNQLRATDGGKLGLVLWGQEDRAYLCEGGQPLLSIEAPVGGVAAFTESEIITADMELTIYGKDGVKALPLPHKDRDMALECAGGATYIVTREGVDCLEQGAALFQTLLRGSLYTFSDPNSAVKLLRCDPADRTFYMAVETGNKERLFRYSFDPDMSLTPDEQLNVFSMEDSPSIRGAMVEFQRAHPTVMVNYQVGADSPMEREDVETALREALAAGQGPDVLLLDGLDLQAYAKWLAPLDVEIPGGFANITAACRQAGALPTRFELWLDVAPEGAIPYQQKIMGLEGLAYTLSGLRDEQGAADPEALGGYFRPAAILGVTNTGGQPELVKAFVAEMFSEGVQSEDYGEGFPVMEAQFRDWLAQDFQERFQGMTDGMTSLCRRLKRMEE